MVSTTISSDSNRKPLTNWCVDLVFDKVRAHAILLIVSVLFLAAAFGINISLGRDIGASAGPYLGIMFGLILPVTFAASLILVFLYLLIIKRPDSPTKAMINFYRPLLTNPQRYANALIILGGMILAFMAFGETKPLIPVMNSYSWDERFMRLDRLIHFGQDPWRLIDPVLGHELVTQWINYAYNMWFLIMFSFWMAAAWSTRSHAEHGLPQAWERQFALSFILTWIVGGIILATVFSSLGPAFYDLVDTANNPYAAQMVQLHAVHESHNLWAINTQDMLRNAYLNPAPGQLSGISAMPSIHNATSTIFMLAAYRINKRFGHVMLAFLICIMLGSVHLAWHYAVDAYLGILIAVVIWKISAPLLRWQDRKLSSAERA